MDQIDVYYSNSSRARCSIGCRPISDCMEGTETSVGQDEFPGEEAFLTLTLAFYSIMGGFTMPEEPASKLSDAPKGQPND